MGHHELSGASTRVVAEARRQLDEGRRDRAEAVLRRYLPGIDRRVDSRVDPRVFSSVDSKGVSR